MTRIRRPNISRLPKVLRDKPAIRALALAVYPATAEPHPTAFYVLGRSATYLVERAHGAFVCTTPGHNPGCIAAQARRTCAHTIAAERYAKEIAP